MNTSIRRLLRLEHRFVPQVDEEGMRLLALLLARRRRLAEERGEPFEDWPRESLTDRQNGLERSPKSCKADADVLQKRGATRRYAREAIPGGNWNRLWNPGTWPAAFHTTWPKTRTEMITRQMRKRLERVQEQLHPKDPGGGCTLEELCRSVWRQDKKRFRKLAEYSDLRLFIRQFEREDIERK